MKSSKVSDVLDLVKMKGILRQRDLDIGFPQKNEVLYLPGKTIAETQNFGSLRAVKISCR
jgi:hypothetical protein